MGSDQTAWIKHIVISWAGTSEMYRWTYASTNTQISLIWPQVYKTFFMLNSAEHEIWRGNKSQITTNCKLFLANIAEHENFSANKYENANYCWHFLIY